MDQESGLWDQSTCYRAPLGRRQEAEGAEDGEPGTEYGRIEGEDQRQVPALCFLVEPSALWIPPS